MNPQRKTSNLINIVSYDDAGNVTLPASLSIPSSGHLLVGTLIDSGYKLDVNGNTRLKGNVIAENGYVLLKRAGSPGMWITDTNLTNSTYSIYVHSTGQLKWGINTDGLSTTNGDLMTLNSSGVLSTFGNIVAGGGLFATVINNAVTDPDKIAVFQLNGSQYELKYMTKAQLNLVPTSRTLTINGTTYDLSADRSWTIAAGVSSFNTRTGAITLGASDVTTALTYTPVTNARILTINGTAYDLSTDRSWSVPNFYTADGVLTGNRTITQDGFSIQFDTKIMVGMGMEISDGKDYYSVAIGADGVLASRTTGDLNTAVGYTTLPNVTSGAKNAAFGQNAGAGITQGNNNTIIGGGNFGTGITTGSYNTVIGQEVVIGNVSNNIVLADGNGTIKYRWDGTTNNIYGSLTISSIAAAAVTTDKILVSDSGVIKYRTAAQILSEIGAVPTTRTITINGTTLDLSADRSWTIASGGISGSGTTNYVTKWTGAGSIGNSVIYDTGVNAIIGSTSDTGHKLQVIGKSYFSDEMSIGSTTDYGNARLQVTGATNDQNAYCVYFTNASNTGYFALDNKFRLYMNLTGGGTFGIDITGNPVILRHENSNLDMVGSGGLVNMHLEFYGGIYVNPGNNSNVNFWIKGQTNSNLFYAKASTDNIGIGTTSPGASAILEISSTTKGFLPPRMTGAQAEAIATPAEGLLVYATSAGAGAITTKGWWGYDGSTWVKLN